MVSNKETKKVINSGHEAGILLNYKMLSFLLLPFFPKTKKKAPKKPPPKKTIQKKKKKDKQK